MLLWNVIVDIKAKPLRNFDIRGGGTVGLKRVWECGFNTLFKMHMPYFHKEERTERINIF